MSKIAQWHATTSMDMVQILLLSANQQHRSTKQLWEKKTALMKVLKLVGINGMLLEPSASIFTATIYLVHVNVSSRSYVDVALERRTACSCLLGKCQTVPPDRRLCSVTCDNEISPLITHRTFYTVSQKNSPFYRAMHLSAKRRLAIACRLSVCPSVTLVDCDHISWKSWKLIINCTNNTVISLTPSLFVARRPSTYTP